MKATDRYQRVFHFNKQGVVVTRWFDFALLCCLVSLLLPSPPCHRKNIVALNTRARARARAKFSDSGPEHSNQAHIHPLFSTKLLLPFSCLAPSLPPIHSHPGSHKAGTLHPGRSKPKEHGCITPNPLCMHSTNTAL
eukprot:3936318-Rhodomonas_salina.5